MADAAYGLWPLVILNIGLFVLFAISFFHPRGQRDWRAMGAFTAPVPAGAAVELRITGLAQDVTGTWSAP